MVRPKKDWRGESRSGPARTWQGALADKTRAMQHIRATARGLRASGSVLAFPNKAKAKTAEAPVALAAQTRSSVLVVLAKLSIALILGAGVIFEAFKLP